MNTPPWPARRSPNFTTCFAISIGGSLPSTRRLTRFSAKTRPANGSRRSEGVGPKTATAVIAAIGDGSEFKNDRHLAAWVGLVPRQFSSGDRKILKGISKRGSLHLRSLLVHGARSVVRTAPNKTDPANQWVNQLRQRRGFNRATVALADHLPCRLLKARLQFARRRRRTGAQRATFTVAPEAYQL